MLSTLDRIREGSPACICCKAGHHAWCQGKNPMAAKQRDRARGILTACEGGDRLLARD